jgi:hypothetical protein
VVTQLPVVVARRRPPPTPNGASQKFSRLADISRYEVSLRGQRFSQRRVGVAGFGKGDLGTITTVGDVINEYVALAETPARPRLVMRKKQLLCWALPSGFSCQVCRFLE